MKEIHRILYAKTPQNLPDEGLVRSPVGCLRRQCIRKVASAVSGDQKLPARFFHLLKNRHRRALPGGGDGRCQSGRACADNDNLCHGSFAIPASISF